MFCFFSCEKHSPYFQLKGFKLKQMSIVLQNCHYHVFINTVKLLFERSEKIMKSHSNILRFLHKIGCLKFRDCFGTKGKHTSPTGIDITCTRLSVVFVIRRIEHRFLVSLNFNTHVKDTKFFFNYR